MPAVNSQPLCLRPCLILGVGGRKKTSDNIWHDVGQLLEFSRTLELYEGVEARGVEKTISRDLAMGIGGNQRFADKVGDVVAISESEGCKSTAAAIAASNANSPAKMLSRRSTARSSSGSS